MAGTPEARFSLNFDSNAGQVGGEAAKALDDVRQKILGSQNAIRDLSSSYKSLRGSSDDVKAAKDQLKAKIDAERNAISANSLELLKAGTSYQKLTAQAKDAAKAEDASAKAATASSSSLAHEAKAAADAHGSQASALERVKDALDGTNAVSKGTLRDFGDLRKAVSGAGGAMGVAVIGAVLFVGALVKVAKAAADAAIALGGFILGNANTERTMLLNAQGFLGSAESARNFAEQVDDLSGRVPMARDEIGKLGEELAGKGLKGDELVDAMNAIAQTASGKGQAAGEALKAQLEASLGAGAHAARVKAEKELGALNADKMLDLTVQGEHFHDLMKALTRDVNLTPLLKGLQQVIGFFDQGTVTGQAVKDLVVMIGNGLSNAAASAAPMLVAGMKQLLIYTLEGAISFFQLRDSLRDTFGSDTKSSIDGAGIALAVMKYAVDRTKEGLEAVYLIWRLLAAQIEVVSQVLGGYVTIAKDAKKALTEGWNDIGKQIVTGLASGITGSAGVVVNAVTGLASQVKSAFTGSKGIDAHSPSRVFADYGEMTAAGFEQGVSGSAGASAADAVTAMALPPGSVAGSGGRGGGGGAVTVNVAINVDGGAGGADVAKQVTQPSVLAAITKAVEDALGASGYAPARGGV